MDEQSKKIAFELELLYRRTNTETGSVELVSKIYIILRDSYETAKKDSIEFLHGNHDDDAIFSNDEGHIIHQDPIDVVSITKSGSLGADWMISAALDDFGYRVGLVKHRSPEDLPIDKKNHKSEKIAFRLELLFRWTNTETGFMELVSRIFIVLRDNHETAKRESIDFLHGEDSLFRNDEGVIIKQDPVKVASVTYLSGADAKRIVKNAHSDLGFCAGVVKHRASEDFPLDQ